MKFKALLGALFLIGLAAPVALTPAGAKPPPPPATTGGTTTTTTEQGRGHKQAGATTAGCHPVSLILNGTLVSVSGTSFKLDVKNANHHAKSLVGTQATIGTDEKTKIHRENVHDATLADLEVGDRLNVQVRACVTHGKKKSEGTSTTPATTTTTSTTETKPVAGSDTFSNLVAKRVNAHPARPADSGAGTSTTTTPSS